jgi:hypothetical protein
VRRLSVASLDSGAESPVYGDEPAAWAGPRGIARPGVPKRPQRTLGGAAIGSVRGSCRERPGRARRAASRTGPTASRIGPVCLASRAIVGRAAQRAPAGFRPSRDGRVRQSAAQFLPRRRRPGFPAVPLMYSIATPGNWRHVGCRPAKRKMVCKGHPCIHAADEDPMTWFASSMTARHGRRILRKRTDVHGREG